MQREPVIPPKFLLATSAESRKLDERTIADFGIDGFTLMEVAALKTASYIRKIEGDFKKGLFICGKGNNAGDALAAARYLADQGNHSITVHLVFGDSGLSPDTQKNLSLLKTLQKQGAEIVFIDSLTDKSFFSSHCHYIVDGIFGTGLNSDLRKPLPSLVQAINQAPATVYSLDVPSGLNADSGLPQGVAVRADTTLTFGTNKVGFYLNNARLYTGNVIFLELPFPRHLQSAHCALINREFQALLPKPSRSAAHKYQKGVVHIVAGSEGLTGAAIMAAKSAWKQGAGAVLLYAPKKLLPVYEAVLPQIIKIPVGGKTDSWFQATHADQILKSLNDKKGVLLAGPGIGIRPGTGTCIETLLKNYDGPVIADADALAFWDRLSGLPAAKKAAWVLTPHIGEAKTHLQATFDNDYERLQWAGEFCRSHQCSVVSKGDPTIISVPEGFRYVTEYSTEMFTRAGFGDVLSGAISANLAITEEEISSIVHALCDGFNTYKNLSRGEEFGPEHLI